MIIKTGDDMLDCINQISPLLTAIATVAAAFAALKANQVSNRSLQFQKTLANNQVFMPQLYSVLNDMQRLHVVL